MYQPRPIFIVINIIIIICKLSMMELLLDVQSVNVNNKPSKIDVKCYIT